MQRAVRASAVVILLPPRQRRACIVTREEHLDIQALISEASIETLNEAILDRLAGSDKLQLDAVTIGPGIHDPTGEFAAIVHGD